LQLIEYAILNFPKTKLHVILVYGFRLPDSRWGLTHFSAKREINRLTTESYAKAMRTFLREHSGDIDRLQIELFSGCNSFAFQNFSEQLDVKDAVVPKGKFLQFDQPKCFDPIRLIKKNMEHVIEIPLEMDRVPQKTKFSLLSLLNL
jgi:hypothetical protein